MRRAAQRRALAPLGLSVLSCELLRAVRLRGQPTLTELAQSVGTDVGTTSRQVGVLSRQGLVRVARDDDDARRRRLALTERGRAALEAALQSLAALDRHVAPRLGGDDRAAVLATLACMRRAGVSSPAARDAAAAGRRSA